MTAFAWTPVLPEAIPLGALFELALKAPPERRVTAKRRFHDDEAGRSRACECARLRSATGVSLVPMAPMAMPAPAMPAPVRPAPVMPIHGLDVGAHDRALKRWRGEGEGGRGAARQGQHRRAGEGGDRAARQGASLGCSQPTRGPRESYSDVILRLAIG
jgi:hypothetical protein